MRRMLLNVMFAVAAVLSSPAVRAADVIIDGVPLPADMSVQRSAAHGLAGTAWAGSWDDVLKHILIIESVAADGRATVVYAIGGNAAIGIKPQWLRLNGTFDGTTLVLTRQGFSVTYDLSGTGRLRGTYTNGKVQSLVVLTKTDMSALQASSAKINWSAGDVQRLPTALTEDGKSISLETILYTPPGKGPFPLAVLNHGSTGDGDKPAWFKFTWRHAWLADVLNEQGWIVAFPQRRGRGTSDGLYDEGFGTDRAKGYTCEAAPTLAGADRALGDIAAAVAALKTRPDVAATRILVGGQSRGGILSVAYAGRHPEQVAGVINFVGGWVGDDCNTAATVNGDLFKQGAAFKGPTLWLYGNGDPFYATSHSRTNFAGFERAGGSGRFTAFDIPGGNGHYLINYPSLWTKPLADHLTTVAGRAK
jgi:dienelactone hydrolase